MLRLVYLLVLACLPLSVAAQDTLHQDMKTLEGCVQAYAPGGDQARVFGGCVGTFDRTCGDQTTFGTADCMMREYAGWDGLLNAWWKPLKQRAQAVGKWEQVLQSQRRWLKATEVECARQYDEVRGATIRVIVGAQCQRDFAAKRAIEFYFALNR